MILVEERITYGLIRGSDSERKEDMYEYVRGFVCGTVGHDHEIDHRQPGAHAQMNRFSPRTPYVRVSASRMTGVVRRMQLSLTFRFE